MVFIGIVYELVEAFTGGLHVHACQSHSIPRLIAESPFVDPPAIDGRQAIDDASTDCEFRVGGQFREMNRGYGKLLKMDFHDSTCDNNFRTDEQIDCPIRCNRYLDRTLQV